MPRILIIGIGNSLRSDDGVGWLVAQELSRDSIANDIAIIATQQLTPEIAESISRAERVLFVDALHGSEPGSVQCDRLQPAPESSADSHLFSPAHILTMAKDLYQRCPEAYLLTIAGESFTLGEKLSARVENALPVVKQVIARFLAYARRQDGELGDFVSGM